MSNFFGCLFVLIFGFLFLLIAFAGMFVDMLRGGHGRSRTIFDNDATNRSRSARNSAGTGDAHHESRKNSRQRRSGKIFSKEEGEYVDFEEV